MHWITTRIWLRSSVPFVPFQTCLDLGLKTHWVQVQNCRNGGCWNVNAQCKGPELLTTPLCFCVTRLRRRRTSHQVRIKLKKKRRKWSTAVEAGICVQWTIGVAVAEPRCKRKQPVLAGRRARSQVRRPQRGSRRKCQTGVVWFTGGLLIMSEERPRHLAIFNLVSVSSLVSLSCTALTLSFMCCNLFFSSSLVSSSRTALAWPLTCCNLASSSSLVSSSRTVLEWSFSCWNLALSLLQSLLLASTLCVWHCHLFLLLHLS